MSRRYRVLGLQPRGALVARRLGRGGVSRGRGTRRRRARAGARRVRRRCDRDRRIRAWPTGSAGDISLSCARRLSLRNEPDLGGETDATAIIGEVVRVNGQQGGWSRLVLDDGRDGWIETDALLSLDAREGAQVATQ